MAIECDDNWIDAVLDGRADPFTALGAWLDGLTPCDLPDEVVPVEKT